MPLRCCTVLSLQPPPIVLPSDACTDQSCTPGEIVRTVRARFWYSLPGELLAGWTNHVESPDSYQYQILVSQMKTDYSPEARRVRELRGTLLCRQASAGFRPLRPGAERAPHPPESTGRSTETLPISNFHLEGSSLGRAPCRYVATPSHGIFRIPPTLVSRGQEDSRLPSLARRGRT